MKLLFTAATFMAVMTLATPVWADGASNNCNGRDSCSTTNNTLNNTTNKGGTGIGIGVGKGGEGGDASARASSTNLNTNLNSNKNSNRNSATAIQGQKQNQGQVQGQSLKNNVNASSSNTVSNSVTVEGDDYDYPVNSAIAPALAGLAPADCVLSTTGSAGVQTFGFGISGGYGETYAYVECNAREAMKIVCNLPGDMNVGGIPAAQVCGNMALQLTGVSASVKMAGGGNGQAEQASVNQITAIDTETLEPVEHQEANASNSEAYCKRKHTLQPHITMCIAGDL